ncbi:restriction endonuclease subunit S [Sulfitobacter sp.]|uniref:restriction endonuclease subunit S n=1 Tax=Sulfitobacter sp. TaxID=1903071 RepID=UPI004058169B
MSSDAVGAGMGEVSAAQRLVPKLRFPEFRDAGEWEFKPLHSMAKRKTRRNTDHEITRVLTNSAEHGIVDQKDFFEKDIAIQGNLVSYFVVEEGDYVYNPRVSSLAPVGPIGKNKVGTGVMSPLYTVFGFEGGDDSFYEHFFRSALWHDYMRSASNSGARHDRMAISNDDFMAMPVPAPCTNEQQKIANCLSSLDELIAAGGERLAALGDYKKGLMQQLFPRPERIENGKKIPAETIPRLRFPEFRDAQEWDWTPVDAIAAIFKGKGISKADIVADGQRPCVRYGELYTTYGEVIDEVASRTNVPKRDLFMSRANDVIIPASGETKIDIATAACVIHDDIALGGDLNVIRSAHNGIFLSYFFNGPLKSSIAKVAQGDSVVHLYPSQIGTLNIAIPSADEQKRIADTMFAVDRALVERRQQITALKAHKAGLMQQLFPSPVERGA